MKTKVDISYIEEYVDYIVNIYKKNEGIFSIVIKFLFGVILTFVLSSLAYGNIGFSRKMMIAIVSGIVGVIGTTSAFVVFMGLVVCYFVSTASTMAAICVVVAYFLVFVFYVRLFPKESLLILIMVIAYAFKLPYIVPIFVGLYVGLGGAGAVAVAAILHEYLYIIEEVVKIAPKSAFSTSTAMDQGIETLGVVVSNFDKAHLSVAVVFFATVVVGWVINGLFMDKEREIALVSSCATMIIGVIVSKAAFGASVSIIGAIIGVAISLVLIYLFMQFDYVLDYKKAEKVKFQDSDYIYYVRAVPKIKR